MRNLSIFILLSTSLSIISCSNSKQEFNKHASLKPDIENTKKDKQTVDKSTLKIDIENNLNNIKDIEKEINDLLKDF